ncbi:glycoside hydrolase family 13 protein [Massilia sp. CCM 9210]|uniref:glycoside hydrolase family 13 protein n=1 Tax=Massilia scottii TaxID=3057166 RepID=UPI002796AEC0|nr:glycoside hydrolase family 13 protein [Massilia sp. CCM 9210]MDQ1813977.1 glycoside hydrolase family 13 protein [Massilia sp. CCM 9210]
MTPAGRRTPLLRLFAVAALGSAAALAGAASLPPGRIAHLEPPSWWTGMRHNKLQLMVHGERIADTRPAIDYPGVRIDAVTQVANRNYLFIDLLIGPDARPGTFDILFKEGARTIRHPYQLQARDAGSAQRQGFGSKDAIYQIMPDRFANGDPANDNVPGMADQANRASGTGRHGGDLRGVADHLDYIAAMGFTQIWPTPLVENDMPAYSYHGYAATNHYRIDPRYGSNEDYRRLSAQARKKGIGIIQDVVLSHIGSHHWWMKDLPSPDWTTNGGTFTPTQHHRVSVQDPYGSQQDRANFTKGWFASSMPDLNQANPLVANYLIQNNIWWIEYAGLSGLRIDTYGYSDSAFLTEYTRRLMAEYPNLNLVGEEWHKSPAVVSHWQRGKVNFNGYISHLPSLMDFPMAETIRATLAATDPAPGFTDVYEMLSQDHLYPDPGNLVLFEGNHDIARTFSVVGEDLKLYKMSLAMLMTLPRIPQFYYGTEVLMTSETKTRDDASFRQDFPGGWRADAASAFTGDGLNAQQREAQAFVKKLVNWRKSHSVIHHGKTMHYGAENGTWVYFRYDGKNKVMVALNKGDKDAVLPLERFHEMLKGAKKGTDAITGATHAFATALTLPARSALILEIE